MWLIQFKIIKMTTTFQTIKHTLRPKYLHSNWREYSCQPTNTNIKSKIRNGSSFLVKFLENENRRKDGIKTTQQGFCSCSHDRRVNEKNFKPKFNRNGIKNEKELISVNNSLQPLHALHSYDPVYAVVKPFTPTSDDILVQDIPESIGENNIISRNNYNVVVLSTPLSYPPGFFEPTFKYIPLTEFEKSMINMAGKLHEVDKNTLNVTENKVSRDRKAKPEHLERIYNILSNNLPRFFTEAHDYSIYTPDVEFNNNIRGVRTKGLASYVQQLALVRIVGHLKFAHVRFELLKITKHPDDGTIRVRWRIRGLSALKAIIKIWSIKHWDKKKLLEEESDWYDGFSIFYVCGSGLVHRHDCDKMIPDEENKVETNQSLAAKLALLLGILHRPALEDLNTVMMALIKMNGLEDVNTPNQHIVK